MLTIPEFNEATDRYMRWRWRIAWASMPFSLAAVYGFMWRDCLGDWLRTHLNPTIPTWCIWVLPLTGTLVLSLVSEWWNRVAVRRDPRLVCPHCNRWLFHSWPKSRRRVVATRKCDRCRQVVLADPDPQLSAPPELTREAVEEWAAHRRRVRKWILASVLLLFPLVFCVLPFGVMALVMWIDETARGFWALLATCTGVLVTGVLVFEAWGIPRVRRWCRSGVDCPRCQRVETPDWVLEFGHCGWCSQALIGHPHANGTEAVPCAPFSSP